MQPRSEPRILKFLIAFLLDLLPKYILSVLLYWNPKLTSSLDFVGSIREVFVTLKSTVSTKLVLATFVWYRVFLEAILWRLQCCSRTDTFTVLCKYTTSQRKAFSRKLSTQRTSFLYSRIEGQRSTFQPML